MREFSVYDPSDFGLHGTPAGDEAYVILKDLNNNKSYLTYIVTDDMDAPPVIDLDSMEEIVIDTDDKTPVFAHISMRKDGTVMMDSGNEIILNEKQNMMMAYPSTLYVLEGRFVTPYNDESTTVFQKDLTLEGIPAIKLDYKRVVETIKERYPDLLKNTHERYGNKFPYFPFAKYYEDMDKMVVFLTRSQTMNLHEGIVKGQIPFYKNYYLAENWNINNVYGVCIIDENEYSLRLISPKGLSKWQENEKNKESEKEESR